MTIEIKLIGPEDCNEYKDALSIKQKFQEQLPESAVGKILIINSATLFGQEIKDIDLILIGNLNRFQLNFRVKAVGENEYSSRDVYINNFCFVIETKRHRPDDICMEGLILKVLYNGKKHDVTTQSEKQKYSLIRFFEERLNVRPYICNFIWLLNLNPNSIKELTGRNSENSHNLLPANFSLKWLFQLACVQKPLKNIEDQLYLKFNSFSSDLINNREQEIINAFNIFDEIRGNTGELTRKKMEAITKKLLRNQLYAQEVGKKLLEISGKAGTGKTMKLLTLAIDLANNHNKRCLILTYNHALVSDIKRLLAFIGIPDGVNTYTVKISTLHKFFYEILIGFKIINAGCHDFIGQYDSYIDELYNYIDKGLIENREIQDLMNSRHEEVAWDLVLIDESQDWNENEKNILFKIFGPEKLILANGEDQLVRRQIRCNWTQGVQHNRIPGLKSLRQEKDLVTFVNRFSNKFNINWEVAYSDELVGGKIYILSKDIDSDFYQEQYNRLKEKNNRAYDMLFLVPPSLVSKSYCNGKEIRNFNWIYKYREMGAKFWDGTNTDIRTEYSVNVDEHRVLQYESCRGLEGWTVVCLHLDDFVKYKKETFEESWDNELALTSKEEKREKFAYLWALIPLTRAIDTLLITLKDRNSEFSKKLYELYQENKDFVDWIE
jgi:hypothetical protein